MKRPKLLTIATLLLSGITAKSQMKIGDNVTTINSGSLLELESTNKGFVLPRVALTSLTATSPLTSALTGTMVYNTVTGIGSGVGVYYWNGSSWIFIVNSGSNSNWALTGNTGISASTNFLGTTDAQPLIIKTNGTERMRILSSGYIGIGNTIPTNALSIIASNPLYLSGLTALTSVATTDSVLTISAGIVKKAPSSLFSGGSGSGWSLTGNSISSGNFLGTTNNQDLVFQVNSTQAGSIGGSSNNYPISYGVASSASGYGTAIGYNTQAVWQSTAIGAGAKASGSNSSLAIGYNSTASTQNSIAIGTTASASGSTQNIAIGYNATASAYNSIAIGSGATATTGNNTIAIGLSSSATGYIAMGVGNGATAPGQYAIAFGSGAQATALNANAFGYATTASANNTLAVGNSATASAANAITVGFNSTVSGSNAVAIGSSLTVSQANAFILGGTSANVGIGTTTPNTSTKLDVAGSTKLGSGGSVIKDIATGSLSINQSVTNGSYSDFTITLNSTLSGTNGSVAVSPGFDMARCVIAYARITGTTTVLVRIRNVGSSSETLSGTLYVTATDF